MITEQKPLSVEERVVALEVRIQELPDEILKEIWELFSEKMRDASRRDLAYE